MEKCERNRFLDRNLFLITMNLPCNWEATKGGTMGKGVVRGRRKRI